MNPHWRPQHLNIFDGVIDYDFIGHLESFAEDISTVSEATGLPIEAVVRRNTLEPRNLFEGRPDLVRRVEVIYSKDFELFGYQ